MSEVTVEAPTRESLRLQRLAATVLDLLILGPSTLLIMLATGLVESAEAWVMPQPIIRLTGLVLGTYLLLNGYLLVTRGQTLGKRLLRLRIVDSRSGERLPLWRLLLRAFGLPALALPGLLTPLNLELFVVAYTVNVLLILAPAQRCLHDYLAGSEVIRPS